MSFAKSIAMVDFFNEMLLDVYSTISVFAKGVSGLRVPASACVSDAS